VAGSACFKGDEVKHEVEPALLIAIAALSDLHAISKFGFVLPHS
jgi:hypothetical protein